MSEFVCVDLPQDRIRDYCANQPIQRLSVFGSAVRNELTPESDIDLLVEYLIDAPVGYFTMAQHMLDFAEIFDRRVDLATPDSLSPYIRQAVLDSAELIYAKDQRE
ncbi:MAG: nucleotidyltransferase domain-containing protein [Chloroflexi bacterium]|nr:nucleotidyltransferase domain-containing protein [Chloroflexota bacterium]